MQWSQLKKRAEDLLCEQAHGRVQYFCTRYRDKNDNDGRAWIAVDGAEILNACDRTYMRLQHEGVYGPNNLANYHTKVPKDTYENVRKRLREQGIYGKWHFTSWLDEYVNTMKAHDAVGSPIPLLRFFGILDKRVGARTLENIEPKHSLDEHALAIRRV